MPSDSRASPYDHQATMVCTFPLYMETESELSGWQTKPHRAPLGEKPISKRLNTVAVTARQITAKVRNAHIHVQGPDVKDPV